MVPTSLLEIGLPVLFALFLWWFSTGLVLLLDGLPRAGTRRSLAIATLVAIGALVGLARTAQDDSVAGAYAAFVCALLVWAWQELSFLTGAVTGPRKHASSAAFGDLRHLVHAVQAILYHELAIAASGLLILALTWDAPNQVGTWTFLVLWVMRISAKLNLFLGVRNSGAEFLPAHLAYLTGYFRTRPMNMLFPVSVTAATVAATLLVQAALAPQSTPAATAGLMLVAALLGLASLEHWMMVLPVRVSALWEWALRAHRDAAPLAAHPQSLARLDVPPQQVG
jgi:putative photosynthetic complex assembly protein 2